MDSEGRADMHQGAAYNEREAAPAEVQGDMHVQEQGEEQEQEQEQGDEQEQEQSGQLFELREQDRWLPINNVARLMKNTLPMTAKVSKGAKMCMQECVSEFISFVTSEASDRCTADKRKTINGEDILISLHALGFENYAEVLKIYLAKYRHQQALRNQQMLEEEERLHEQMQGEQYPDEQMQGGQQHMHESQDPASQLPDLQ